MTTPLYDHPNQFEPLLPAAALQEPLLAKAHDLALSASGLANLPLAAELRSLLRAMNSYYSNRIEGQHTRPHELEQALRHDYSKDTKLAARQRLAIAHIDAEVEIEARYAGAEGAARLFLPGAIQDIHRALFSRLRPDDLQTDQGAPIEPGKLRDREVSVGQHVAPQAASLAAFLDRWASFYGRVRRGDAALVAMAAAHQRLGWIYPFVDGNGRVMRLHTHALLGALGYTGGMWSPLRGFARSVDGTTRCWPRPTNPVEVTSMDGAISAKKRWSRGSTTCWMSASTRCRSCARCSNWVRSTVASRRA